jgi:hypothetical protein
VFHYRQMFCKFKDSKQCKCHTSFPINHTVKGEMRYRQKFGRAIKDIFWIICKGRKWKYKTNSMHLFLGLKVYHCINFVVFLGYNPIFLEINRDKYIFIVDTVLIYKCFKIRGYKNQYHRSIRICFFYPAADVSNEVHVFWWLININFTDPQFVVVMHFDI